MAFAAD